MPIPVAAQCCLLYSALASEGVYGTVLLPALLDVENEAGPVLVAEVMDFRLVSAPSMMKMGGVVVLMRLYISGQEVNYALKLYCVMLPNQDSSRSYFSPERATLRRDFDLISIP